MKVTSLKIFLYPILFLTTMCYCQEKSMKGEVRNKEDKSVLGYVNIGIADKGIGTVSNSKGLFLLQLNGQEKLNDTILFSHIGFKTTIKILAELNSVNNVIELEPETDHLREVVVKFVKPKAKRFGRNSKGFGLMHYNFYSYYEKNVDDRLSKEIGMKFKIKKDCKIDDLNFHIDANEFKSLKFSLNFYKIDNGLPTEIIIDKDIIFEITDGRLVQRRFEIL